MFNDSSYLLQLIGMPGRLVTLSGVQVGVGSEVLNEFPGGADVAVATGEQLILVHGQIGLNNTATGSIRLENQSGTAMSNSFQAAGPGDQFGPIDVPITKFAKGDEPRITVITGGTGFYYGWGVILPDNSDA